MRRKGSDETSIWISNTDLISGLLVLFLFIAILMNQGLMEEQAKVTDITSASNQVRQELKESLENNFTPEEIKQYNIDLKDNIGDASFDKGDGRFEVGSAVLREDFKRTLDVFLPKYLKAINDVYQKDPSKIKEIRVEGHTSSEWSTDKTVTANQAYINNMKLSQDRTRAIIDYAFYKSDLVPYQDLIKKKLTANGLSSSHLKTTDGTENGLEDAEASRRIEFRVVVNDKATLDAIKEAIK